METLDTSVMVADAQSRVEGLTPTDLAAALDGETLVVDVRELEERLETGILPGALPVPRGLLEFYADSSSGQHHAAFEPNRRMILYCNDGSRSALATDTLARMGYWRVAYLEGGLDAWKGESRGVVSFELPA